MNPLLVVLRDPSRLATLDTGAWDLLLRSARQQRLLGHLDRLLQEQGLSACCPPAARVQLEAFAAQARFLATQVRWEVRQVRRVLGPAGIPIMLLKGAAYLQLGLPVAHRRPLSDLDLLLPRPQLKEAERLLIEAGWETGNPDPYNQRYYRDWMHELPPLQRRDHSLELDLHHNLLPPTGRLHPDPRLLWQAATDHGDGLWTPNPRDLLLHSAAHLFEAGDLQGGLRDLVDLHGLLLAYSHDEEFRRSLVDRARQLELLRPLRYALECADRLLHSPLPAEIRQALGSAPGSGPLAPLTRRLMLRVLAPQAPDRGSPRLASFLLFVRSHWLRMPPLLLLRHLVRKSLRRQAPATIPRGELM